MSPWIQLVLTAVILSVQVWPCQADQTVSGTTQDGDQSVNLVHLLLSEVELIQKRIDAQNGRLNEVEGRVSDLETSVAGREVADDKKLEIPSSEIDSVDPKLRRSASKNGTKGLFERDLPNVAFSTFLSHELKSLPKGYIIKCDQVMLNDGAGYNNFIGVFTVPVRGVYLFTFSMASKVGAYSGVRLVLDGKDDVGSVVRPYTTNYYSMGSNTAIIRLSAGQVVWLEMFKSTTPMSVYSDDSSSTSRLVTFSGYRIY